MGFITTIIEHTETYQSLKRVAMNLEKSVVEQAKDIEELSRASQEKKIDKLELEVKIQKAITTDLRDEIVKVTALVRQQTEADILWRAEQIEAAREQHPEKAPAIVKDARLDFVGREVQMQYSQTSNPLNPSYATQSHIPSGLLS